jgi:formylglycine-generating enzyme required for sulfatase activity
MKRAALAAFVVFLLATVAIAIASRVRRDRVQCGPGLVGAAGRCLVPEGTCPSPLALGPRGCDAPVMKVEVRVGPIQVGPSEWVGPIQVGPSDWEAEGRVPARIITVRPFAIDAFEVTAGAFDPARTTDLARAASGVARDEAARYCRERGGRLPTEDEWIAAAAGDGARRYPWGDTGAVCRRAAWGLARGPCANGASGPDTVGAHPEGDSPSGVHDLAGNVAEWVKADPPGAPGIVRGGSWASSLATDLRTWSRVQIDPGVHDQEVGFRCAYDL